jgi:hypothetical protein
VPYLPDQDGNGRLLEGHPLLDGPPGVQPGWFAALEVDPAWVHIGNHLGESVTVGKATDRVELPTSSMAATVTPRFELGYRFDQAGGELLASYRFVATSGTDSLSPFGPAGATASVRSRVDLNVLDLDYASREFPFAMGPGWDMKWLAGVRLASLYFDSQASAGRRAQRETNFFSGVGPHAALEVWRALSDTGLSLFARLDAELLVGQGQQTFTETVGARGGETDLNEREAAPVLAVEAGVGWTPEGCSHLRFAGGYLFEHWWDVGLVDQSRAQMTVQGLFLRGEWRY